MAIYEGGIQRRFKTFQNISGNVRVRLDGLSGELQVSSKAFQGMSAGFRRFHMLSGELQGSFGGFPEVFQGISNRFKPISSRSRKFRGILGGTLAFS